MGWSIAKLSNTVKVSKKVAKELLRTDTFRAAGDESLDDILDEDGLLHFNRDHREHMDYVWNEDVQAVLTKHKVKGEITFGSLEGDNAGSFWGYRFDGKGGCVSLKGKVVWEESESESR